jgi:hypothetical protein
MKPKLHKLIRDHAGDPDAIRPLPDNADGQFFVDISMERPPEIEAPDRVETWLSEMMHTDTEFDRAPRRRRPFQRPVMVTTVQRYDRVPFREVVAAAKAHEPTGKCPMPHGGESVTREEQDRIKFELTKRRLLVIEHVWKDRIKPAIAADPLGLPHRNRDTDRFVPTEKIWQLRPNPSPAEMLDATIDFTHHHFRNWRNQTWRESRKPEPSAMGLLFCEYEELLGRSNRGQVDPHRLHEVLLSDLGAGLRTALPVMWGTIEAFPRVFQETHGRLPTEEEMAAGLKASLASLILPLARPNIFHARQLFEDISAQSWMPFDESIFPLNPKALRLSKGGGLILNPENTQETYVVNPIAQLTTGCPAMRIIADMWGWVQQVYRDFEVYPTLINRIEKGY